MQVNGDLKLTENQEREAVDHIEDDFVLVDFTDLDHVLNVAATILVDVPELTDVRLWEIASSDDGDLMITTDLGPVRVASVHDMEDFYGFDGHSGAIEALRQIIIHRNEAVREFEKAAVLRAALLVD